MDIPIITPLFGYVFKFFYGFSQNYLLTLFLFAVVMKIVLLPFGIKQQKNSIKQSKLRPKEMAIRNKYKGRNDKATQQKMQEEIMKLYQEENFNPMGGCLPMLIQLPILFALYAVIINPLTHIAGFDKNAVDNVKGAVTEVNEMLEETGNDTLKGLKGSIGRGDEIGYASAAVALDKQDTVVIVEGDKIIGYVDENGEAVYLKAEDKAPVNDVKPDENEADEAAEIQQTDATEGNTETQEAVTTTDAAGEQANGENASDASANEPAETRREVSVSTLLGERLKDSEKTLDKLHNIKNSFNVFGLDLSENCGFTFPLIIIPILTFIFSFFSTKIIRKFTYQPQMTANADPSQKASMGMMDWMMPLLSVYIAFQLAAAIAVYWIFQNILSALQQILLFKLYPIPPVTEEMIKEAELQLKGKSKQNKQPVLSDDYFDDYDKTIKDETSSNNKKKKSGIISSRKMNKINPKVVNIYKQGRHLKAKKKI